MTNRKELGRKQVSTEIEPRPRSFATLLVLGLCAVLVFAGFAALGTWQLYRLQWKLALIERVDQRVHAVPQDAPGPGQWNGINAEADEYRHVRVAGTYLHPFSTLVQATTELGSGYWLLTPLRSTDGSTILINRGFISIEAAERVRAELPKTCETPRTLNKAVCGQVVVTGLLRMSEPGGGYLRDNDPAANRWYSRDVSAIAAARGLSDVAPYFVDADAGSEKGSADEPVGGLTVISFHNNHLVYALTWYALALMVAAAVIWVARDERRIRRSASQVSQHVEQEGEDARKK